MRRVVSLRPIDWQLYNPWIAVMSEPAISQLLSEELTKPPRLDQSSHRIQHLFMSYQPLDLVMLPLAAHSLYIITIKPKNTLKNISLET